MRTSRPAIVCLVAVMLAGCTSGGVAGTAEDAGFARCVHRAGLSLDGADDWPEAQERAFLGRPAVLDCAATELSGDQREEALGTAFPAEQHEAYVDALVGWVSSRAVELGRAETVDRAARLLDAVEWDSDGALLAAREQVALGVVRAIDGVPDYEQWLADNGVRDDYAGRVQYVIAAERERTPVYEAIESVVRELGDAQSG